MEQALYAVRQKIYPRAVTGLFANLRWSVVLFTQALYYGLPWLSWDERQAVLFDLGARKFYIFGLVLWPQDFVFLAALLILAALALFLFTALAGRLWCGYACPQTVYTEIFLWIERKIEGDRAKRMKLDKSEFSAHKFGLKFAKHAAWIALAFWTGFTFVGYFTPIATLAHEFVTFTVGPWETFWVFFYGFATYGNAGWMREQVCKYMCPYARFQGVMFDPDTLVITYDMNRGEPRGPRGKGVDYKAQGLGMCVDCGICVQVCPTGIDIRNGMQYECIGCGGCVDACNQVMEKVGYPKGLIRYSTENVLKRKYSDAEILRHVFRPRTLIYSTILLIVAGALITALTVRVPLQVDVMRDRNALARETAQGLVENSYRIMVINMDAEPHTYTIKVEGVPNIKVVTDVSSLSVEALSSRLVSVRLQADPADIKGRTAKVTFQVSATENSKLTRTQQTTFFAR
ncbi:MAG: cytochrome c oxidase accessory protein CcoG [Burkholderiales bacterium]|nr:cytochrome c oxidase accessory protein CcoG [Burkholderiales bacterium]